MTTSVLKVLERIEAGEVRWSVAFKGSRTGVDFYSGADWLHRVDVPGVAKLSHRLYEREGFESNDHGRVLLTEEGKRTLRELRGDPEPKSVWSTS